MSALTKVLTKRFERKYVARVMVDGVAQMFHLDATNHHQAKVKAKRHGRVVGLKKMDITYYTQMIEHLNLNQEPLGLEIGKGIYEADIKLDEVLGLKRKRK